jgi:hypothetical protein
LFPKLIITNIINIMNTRHSSSNSRSYASWHRQYLRLVQKPHSIPGFFVPTHFITLSFIPFSVYAYNLVSSQFHKSGPQLPGPLCSD